MSYIFDVTAFGALGDGSDATTAFQNAINAALATTGATLRIPAGRYTISSQLTWQKGSLGSTQPYYISVEGDGVSSVILDATASALFAFNNLVDFLTVKDLLFAPTTTKTGAAQAQLYFPYGNTRSSYASLHATDVAGGKPSCLYYCAPGQLNDTITFENVICTPIQTVGIQIGAGSTIFMSNSRMIGDAAASPIGVLFTGGMGGVYLSSNDIIQCGAGIEINQSAGASNREIFISNTSIDSCNVGLNHLDVSYVAWDGVWAASSNININFAPSGNAAILNMTGGTIFNAHNGAYNYGVSYNGLGRLQMTGVVVRNNNGGGFVMNQPAQVPIMITGCHFFGNTGLGNLRALSGLTQTGNVFE